MICHNTKYYIYLPCKPIEFTTNVSDSSSFAAFEGVFAFFEQSEASFSSKANKSFCPCVWSFTILLSPVMSNHNKVTKANIYEFYICY